MSIPKALINIGMTKNLSKHFSFTILIFLCISLNSCDILDCEENANFRVLKKEIIESAEIRINESRTAAMLVDEKDTLSLSSFQMHTIEDKNRGEEWICTCTTEFDYGEMWGKVTYSIREKNGGTFTTVNHVRIEPVSREIYEMLNGK